MTVDADTAALIGETKDQAVTEAVDEAQVQLEPGTVKALGTSWPLKATITLDSDPSQTPVTGVAVLTSDPLVEGSRIKVLVVPPAGMVILGVNGGGIQRDSTVVTTDTDGHATITLHYPWPAELDGVTVCNGDGDAYPGWVAVAEGSTTSTLRVKAAASTTLRVNWEARGH